MVSQEAGRAPFRKSLYKEVHVTESTTVAAFCGVLTRHPLCRKVKKQDFSLHLLSSM